MDEEEYQRMMQLDMMGAGALAHTENLSAWQKIQDAARSLQESDFWQGTGAWDTSDWGNAYEPGWEFKSDSEMIRDILADNAELVEKIIIGGAGAAAGLPPWLTIPSAVATLQDFIPDLLEKGGLTPQPVDSEGKGEVSGADVPTWEPYTPLEFEPFEPETSSVRDDYTIVDDEPLASYFHRSPGTQEWRLIPITTYNRLYNDSLGGNLELAPPGELHSDFDKSPAQFLENEVGPNPWPEYADAEGFKEEATQPFSRGPDGITPTWSWKTEEEAADEEMAQWYKNEMDREAFNKRNEEEERRHREEYDKMVADMLAEQELEASMDTDFSTGDLGQGSGLSPTGELLKMLGDYFSQDTGTDGWNEPAESTPPSWLTAQ